jgi:hypothetical protein
MFGACYLPIISNNVYMQKMARVVRFSWVPAGQVTVNWNVQHVPFFAYIHYLLMIGN